jgi:mono/diheme cytochrome c family protein
MNFRIICILVAATLLAACSATTEEAAPTLTPLEQIGQSVYTVRCAQCHVLVPDTVVIGPSLAGIATRAGTRLEGYDAQAYIEMSILSPKDFLVDGFPDTMPTNFGKELTSEEFEAVVAFLLTLR